MCLYGCPPTIMIYAKPAVVNAILVGKKKSWEQKIAIVELSLWMANHFYLKKKRGKQRKEKSSIAGWALFQYIRNHKNPFYSLADFVSLSFPSSLLSNRHVPISICSHGFPFFSLFLISFLRTEGFKVHHLLLFALWYVSKESSMTVTWEPFSPNNLV